MKTKLLPVLASFALFALDSGLAGPGDLDPSFGNGGQVFTGLSPAGGYGMIIQGDGKIVVAGGSGFTVARFNINGTPDTTFNNSGQASVVFPGRTSFSQNVAVQADGKIVVSGLSAVSGTDSYDFALARYHPNGSLDTTFNAIGYFLFTIDRDDNGYSLAIQNDGKILVAGANLVRFHENGTLDTSFNGTGIFSTQAALGYSRVVAEIKVMSDGKILLASDLIVRLNLNGSLDTTFNGTGRAEFEKAAGSSLPGPIVGIAVQDDGKIVGAGSEWR